MSTSQLILFGIAMGLAAVGAVFFVAGAPHFGIMDRTYANFGGIAFMVFSGVFWALFGMSMAGKEEEEAKK